MLAVIRDKQFSYHRFLKLPVSYGLCSGVPFSHLLTVFLGACLVFSIVFNRFLNVKELVRDCETFVFRALVSWCHTLLAALSSLRHRQVLLRYLWN